MHGFDIGYPDIGAQSHDHSHFLHHKTPIMGTFVHAGNYPSGVAYVSPYTGKTYVAGLPEEAPATVPLIRVQGLKRWERYVDGISQGTHHSPYRYRPLTNRLECGTPEGQWYAIKVPRPDEIHCPEFYAGPLPEGLRWKTPWHALPVETVRPVELPWGPTTKSPYALVGIGRGIRSGSLEGLLTDLAAGSVGCIAPCDRIVKLMEKEGSDG